MKVLRLFTSNLEKILNIFLKNDDQKRKYFKL